MLAQAEVNENDDGSLEEEKDLSKEVNENGEIKEKKVSKAEAKVMVMEGKIQ